MKTKLYITSFLAISIQMTAFGQNQDNQVNELLNQSNKEKKEKSENQIRFILPTNGNEKSENTTHSGPKIIYEEPNITSENYETRLAQLQQQTETLTLEALSLLQSVNTCQPSLNAQILEKARKTEQQALLIQFEALELAGKINLTRFSNNKLIIHKLLLQKEILQKTTQLTYDLIHDSEVDMRLAKEMRQEAYAEPTIASKIGTLGNAEEKELMALAKQNQAIILLEKTKKEIDI